MRSAQRIPEPWTAEEYLDREERSPTKNELIDGQIYAMAGSSPEHDAIVSNVNAALHALTRGRGCRPYTSDMRIHIPATGRFTYSDGLVVCGRPEFYDPRTRGSTKTLLNPTLVVEVMSPTTEEYDRGDKLANYKTIPSLQEVILIAQEERFVERHQRAGSGHWIRTEVRNGSVELAVLGGKALDLDDVYEDVVPPIFPSPLY
jgi:Uma2 family endonuclease